MKSSSFPLRHLSTPWLLTSQLTPKRAKSRLIQTSNPQLVHSPRLYQNSLIKCSVLEQTHSSKITPPMRKYDEQHKSTVSSVPQDVIPQGWSTFQPEFQMLLFCSHQSYCYH